MYFVACLWFKKEKAQKCASDLLTKAQSESAKRKRSLLNLHDYIPNRVASQTSLDQCTFCGNKQLMNTGKLVW